MIRTELLSTMISGTQPKMVEKIAKNRDLFLTLSGSVSAKAIFCLIVFCCNKIISIYYTMEKFFYKFFSV